MLLDTIDINLTEEQLNKQREITYEQALKSDANARFCMIFTAVTLTLLVIIFTMLGIRSNESFTAYFISIVNSKFTIIPFAMLCISLLFIRLSATLNFTLYCIDHYDLYTKEDAAVKKEYKAHKKAQFGLLVIVVALSTISASVLLNDYMMFSFRAVGFGLFLYGFIQVASSIVIRSGFESQMPEG